MSNKQQAMSMESSAFEEAQMVLAILENKKAKSQSRSGSPFTPTRNSMRDDLLNSPQTAGRSSSRNPAPIRSMLDIGSAPPSGSLQPVRSMLDIDTLPPLSPRTSHGSAAKPTSPIESSFARRSDSPHSLRPAAPKPTNFDSRDYQYTNIYTGGSSRPLMVKRSTNPKKGMSAMADVMRGIDVGQIPIPKPIQNERARAMSASRMQSRSPHNRLSLRSISPHVSLLPSSRASGSVGGGNRTSLSSSIVTLKSGKRIDLKNAYRSINDDELARAGLPELANSKRSHAEQEEGEGRLLQKSYADPDGDPLPDSSDDDAGDSSDEEDHRGRTMDRVIATPAQKQVVTSLLDDTPTPKGSPNSHQAQSLLSAAEEERISEAAKVKAQSQAQASSASGYKYRSLFDEPKITLTDPAGASAKPGKSKKVTPSTSFDRSPSPRPVDSANNSEDEAQFDTIKQAQKLSFGITPIMESADSARATRIIARGNYTTIVRSCIEEGQKPRKYMVATDLSEESTHALEWAIGTVMRDGDTLLAICCVDEEAGLLGPEGKSASSNANQSPARNDRTKLPAERKWAVEEITNKVLRLLRKTKLQVRVLVEVLHCKNPKHVILEVIDLINPELVILGSRGRSAIKGVILGSFSNYLVTKSSVPVMVARKRLRKAGKYRQATAMTQVNVLRNPSVRSLANARID
ncbi:hypothetical protein TD95_000287 [Thielaviopsis punctulata]|uniref:UspA domain-containing protein n=1 Tax=Thielaviopsis punctulata TaxID=72032 RepID=A0A0F4ZF41_9PEZI|nr:hypothetical protein TD95_000287 [Thielaviopsis punctulata]